MIDDLVAFGGSAEAGKRVVEMLGGEVVECLFVFDIPRLREKVTEKLGSTETWAMCSLSEEVLSKLK